MVAEVSTYVDLCDAAMCSPDSRHLAGQSFQWLADRYHRHTGRTIDVAEVERLEDEFYTQQRNQPGVTIYRGHLADIEGDDEEKAD